MLTVDEIRMELEKLKILPRASRYRPIHPKKEGKMNEMERGKKEARPLPAELTSSWLGRARIAEIIKALRENGIKEDLSVKSANELRKMISPFLVRKREKRPERINPGRRRKYSISRSDMQSPAAEIPKEVHPPQILNVFCMRCGYHMQISEPLSLSGK